MNPLLSAMARYFRHPRLHGSGPRVGKRKVRRTRLCLEPLEDRRVPTAVAAPSGLVSWWAGNGNAADSVGPNAGTLNGNVKFATGEVASAFSFTNTRSPNNYVSANTSGLPTGNSDRTLEVWGKVDTFGPNESYFAGYGAFGTNDETYHLGTVSDHRLFFSQWGQAIFGPALQAGQWYHVAVTNSGNSVTLYLNGAPVASGSLPIATPQNTQFYIGTIPGPLGDSRGITGMVDEVSVYNRALTASEIWGIYKAGGSGKVLSPIAVDFPSVVEGAAATTTPLTFTIQRTGSLSGSLTVNWTTADDTAAAGSDYVAASGSVTFASGEATKTVQVTVNGDNTPEADETFKLVLTPSGGTSIMGLATIRNDDATISVGDASAIEGSNTLKFLDRFVSNGSGGLARPRGSTFGPDGNGDGVQDLYVTSADTHAVLRYDGVTGAFIDTFVAAGSGGLSSPVDLAFSLDGRQLYVTSFGSNQLLRYDGTTGAFSDVVSSALSGPEGITLGPDGSLYVANFYTNEVLRYNTSSGLTSFVSASSGTLTGPRKAVLGPDANGDGIQDLYVTSESNSKVLRFDGLTGAFIDTFVNTGTHVGIMWLQVGTDGSVYVLAPTTTTDGASKSISRYTASGGLIDSFALGQNGWGFTLGPRNICYVADFASGFFVDRIGPSSIAAFTVSLASASAGTTTVSYATADGTALAGRDYIATSGTLTFAPGETAKGVLVSTLDDGLADPTRSFFVNLSGPTGGVVADGQGVGTILADTKFYVVDDGGKDNTYQYAAGGAALGNNVLGGGDTAPRGVATTAAGATEWVVDANKTVYVYSTGGALLGSWSAGGLSSSATLTGIATDGTDVWLVDSSADKVYKYASAASRLSGSQNAASSFALAGGKNGDSNPRTS
jgi:hypothetical protein